MFAMRLPPSIRIRPGLELGVAEFLSQYIGILNQFKQIATNVPDRLNGTPSAIGATQTHYGRLIKQANVEARKTRN
jgi:hypothetical protein